MPYKEVASILDDNPPSIEAEWTALLRRLVADGSEESLLHVTRWSQKQDSLGSWRVDSAIEALRLMLPNRVVEVVIMNMLARRGDWEAALQIFIGMQDRRVQLSVGAHLGAINACRKGFKWKKALDLLQRMHLVVSKSHESHMNMVAYDQAYGCVIDACVKTWQLDKVGHLLQAMPSQKLEPTAFSINAYISLCGKRGRWQHAAASLRGLMSSMQAGELSLDQLNNSRMMGCTLTLEACEKAGRWESALDILKQLHTNCLKPNQEIYHAAISVCALSRQWQRASNMIDSMLQENVQPKLVAFMMAINAYSRSGNAQCSANVLRQMMSSESYCDPITIVHRYSRSDVLEALQIFSRGDAKSPTTDILMKLERYSRGDLQTHAADTLKNLQGRIASLRSRTLIKRAAVPFVPR